MLKPSELAMVRSLRMETPLIATPSQQRKCVVQAGFQDERVLRGIGFLAPEALQVWLVPELDGREAFAVVFHDGLDEGGVFAEMLVDGLRPLGRPVEDGQDRKPVRLRLGDDGVGLREVQGRVGGLLHPAPGDAEANGLGPKSSDGGAFPVAKVGVVARQVRADAVG